MSVIVCERVCVGKTTDEGKQRLRKEDIPTVTIKTKRRPQQDE